MSKKLPIASSETVEPRPLGPVAEHFPASQKVYIDELRVPMREITVGGNEPPLRVYDTTGPEGHDIHVGLPRLRQPWIDQRVARGDRNH